ncbi:tetratricopeptide repeat protein [Streptomyces sp. NPDC003691]
MERSRLAGLTGPGGPGSGYAVGGRLVLTSAHVVGRAGARVEVFHPGAKDSGGGPPPGGTAVWCGTPGGRYDAALVLVDEDPRWTAPAGPVRWGRMATDRPGANCLTWGLPDLAHRDGQPPEAEQSRGRINPGSGFVANRYVIDLDRQPPRSSAALSRPWGGQSGAAVFCDRLLVGVVAADRAHSDHSQLTVVPAYLLRHDPGFRAALAAHGGGAEGLEAVEFQHLADLDHIVSRTGRSSPSSLLKARQQSVPFHGREDLLAELTAWCLRDGFGAWLLHGPGGQGKTRLAHQLAGRLAAENWAVLWLHPRASYEQLREIRHASKPLLVVLDYAETRTDQLGALIEAAVEHPGTTPLKVLLLARTDGDWWAGAKRASSLAEDLLDSAPARPLPPLNDDPADRSRSYRSALHALAVVLAEGAGAPAHPWRTVADRLPAPGLEDDAYGNALTLQMAALADLLDTAAPPTAADRTVRTTAAEVEDRLLGHESRYWEGIAVSPGVQLSELYPQALGTALAAAHLAGAADREDADSLWCRIPVLADQPRARRDRITDWVAALYPADTADRVWGSLQPDRLAERLVGRTLDTDPGLAHNLLAGADEARIVQLLSVYSRAAAHPVFRGRLDSGLTGLCVRHHRRLARQIVAVATRTDHPAPLVDALDAIAADPATPLDELDELNNLFPDHSHRLAATSTRLLTTLSARYRSSAAEDRDEHLPGLAKSLHNLGLRLGQSGRAAEGLDALRESVLIRHELALRYPAALPRYAASLNSLAARLTELGQYEESLAVIEEAVKIRRALDEAFPGIHLPDLAMSVDNLGWALGAVGRHEAALATVREAVGLYRALVRDDPRTHRSGLSRVLHNLAHRLREAGAPEDALAAIEEAARIRRALAEADPDAHLRDLSESLEFLSICLGAIGRHRDSLAAVEEAVHIERVLSETDPDAFRYGLATSLTNLFYCLARLGGPADAALAAVAEATDHFAALARVTPDVHLPHLAKSMELLAVTLWETGRRREAITEIGRAVRTRRMLAEANPGLFTEDFENALTIAREFSLRF